MNDCVQFQNLWLKTIDLVVQTITLYQYLERGCPTLLVFGYAGLLAVNSAVYAVCILLPKRFSAFFEVLIDSMYVPWSSLPPVKDSRPWLPGSFDLLVAVVFPILVLTYCYSYFQLDRAVLLLNMKIYPPGSFEYGARLTSDPEQIALFRLIFDSLRIRSLTDLLLRTSMNLSLCYRFLRVVEIKIDKRKRSSKQQAKFKVANSKPAASVISQHKLPRPIALILLLFSTLTIVSTVLAVKSSHTRCNGYPNCVAYAYRWPASAGHCPCIALIDINRAPKSFDEWVSPRNVSDEVAQLTTSGDLQILHLINRHFAEWPEELQRCTNLQHLYVVHLMPFERTDPSAC